jgi:hypothetical protein
LLVKDPMDAELQISENPLISEIKRCLFLIFMK